MHTIGLLLEAPSPPRVLLAHMHLYNRVDTLSLLPQDMPVLEQDIQTVQNGCVGVRRT